MTFFSKILGYRDFAKLEDIKASIPLKFTISDNENLDKVGSLIFFKTKRQQTWLIASNQNLYCVLDDILSDKFEVRWKITKDELVDSLGEVILQIEIDSSFRENSGRIDFGHNHKNWLYSKNLFPSPDKLKKDIEALIKNRMKNEIV